MERTITVSTTVRIENDVEVSRVETTTSRLRYTRDELVDMVRAFGRAKSPSAASLGRCAEVAFVEGCADDRERLFDEDDDALVFEFVETTSTEDERRPERESF